MAPERGPYSTPLLRRPGETDKVALAVDGPDGNPGAERVVPRTPRGLPIREACEREPAPKTPACLSKAVRQPRQIEWSVKRYDDRSSPVGISMKGAAHKLS